MRDAAKRSDALQQGNPRPPRAPRHAAVTLARVAFRFAFVYVLLYAAPWQWLGFIPGVSTGLNLVSRLDDWAVRAANARFFHR